VTFVVEFDEWTGSVWMRRTSDPLSEDDALHWIKYLANQDVVHVRNVVMKQHESIYGHTPNVLVL
jgi:hypothetical protein